MVGATLFAGVVEVVRFVTMSSDEVVIAMFRHHMDRQIERIDAQNRTDHYEGNPSGSSSALTPPLHQTFEHEEGLRDLSAKGKTWIHTLQRITESRRRSMARIRYACVGDEDPAYADGCASAVHAGDGGCAGCQRDR